MRALLAVAAAAITLASSAVSSAALGHLTLDQRRSRAEIVRVFDSHSSTALRVAWCESHWRARAWSGADAGVFQINYSAHHHAGESVSAFQRRMFDRRRNVAFAWRLSRHGSDFYTAWRWSAHCWG